MPALYRHYRPKLFSEISGQSHITDTLTQAFAKQRLAHAYLFYGPRGTGKTTTARLLAKRANCEKAKKGAVEPCLTCASCVALAEGRHLDIIEIDAASNRGIEDIRALREAVTLKPSLGKYKVYIIDEVHMLTNEAFAALLKTLEEPLAHIIFILATTELHKVPATIASRCQVFRFRRATAEELKTRLRWLLKQEKRKADDAALDFIVGRSDGCYRDGESLLGQMMTAQSGTLTRDAAAELLGLPPLELIETFLGGLVKGESAAAVSAVESAHAAGHDAEQFLKEAIIQARGGALALIKEEKDLPAFATLPGARQTLPAIIRALVQAMADLAFVPEPLIAIQLAILTVTSTKGGSPAVPPSPASVATVIPRRPQVVRPLQAEPTSSAELEKICALWPDAIKRMKEKNVVASTFLRALEPMSISQGMLTVGARYALHHNFFIKPENQRTLEEVLSEVIGSPVTLRCVLDPAVTPSRPSTSNGKAEADLLTAAQEIFGNRAS